MDRILTISVAGSRKAARWAAAEMTWDAFADKLREPIRGRESHAAYMRMPKAEQDALKDVGGFVGGSLRDGRRKAGYVTGRDLVTLDLDALRAGSTAQTCTAVSALGCAYAVYSTRKHDPEHPRLRVVLPLDRTVTEEEYEPIARRCGEWLGLEACDPTTFQAFRLMYWPSCSADSEYVYDRSDGPALGADDVLRSYKNWKNVAEWPQVPGQAAARRDAAAKQADPTEKDGIVGAFCRTYGIRRVMDELIPGTYEPTDEPDRWTYTGGSTAGGALVYDDKWLYSHHATDPAGGKLVNSWDLARLHLFGDRDAEAPADTPTSRLPSYRAMADKAMEDPDVKRRMLAEAQQKISEDFGTAIPDGDWRMQLAMNTKGEVLGTLVNLKLIFENDTVFSVVGRDTFQQRNLVRGKLPWNANEGTRDWTDDDDTGAAWYIEAAYGVKDLRRIKMAADMALAAREVDTLAEYLEGLKWDGKPRVERLLVKYLKADDTPYVRAVTRKTLVAAVARAMQPGVKFDSVLTLIGAQGIAKSLFAGILGGSWYNDSIQTFVGKEASEQLRGVWIVEIPEVDRFSAKYEAAAVKQFITRQDDIYREAYGRRTMPHPRRCIFIATTNEPNFLTDASGNRRWWIVRCHATQKERGADMDQLARERDQVWAEAVALWRTGEPLTLDRDLYDAAMEAQKNAQVEEPWVGMIEEFAQRKVPADWDIRKPDDRKLWWADEFAQQSAAGTLVERRKICVAEVWCECFGRDKTSLDGRTSRRILNVLRNLPGWTEVGPRPTVYGCQKCFVYDDVFTPLTIKTAQTPKTTKTTDHFFD